MLLNIKNVSFNYDNIPILKNINITLNSGEFAFLIGKSGSGKTTLLKLIYLDLFPEEGEIEFLNFKSSSITAKEIPLLRRKIGIIFQDFKLIEDRTIYENLEFVLRVTETPKTIIRKKIINALTDVGLSHKQKNYPNELSGGEKQRIAIARAIINEPHLILADEPTGNLDTETGEDIFEILKKINSRGTAIICATHNYELVKKTPAKILKINNLTATQVKLKSVS